MSQILVLGGTRFVGRLTVTQLVAAGHDVTVLSRREDAVPGAKHIVAERSAGLAQLAGRKFDAVLDFIAYDESVLEEARRLGGTYIVVSSAWVPRLNASAADALVPADDSLAPASMLAITKRYLLGKARIEAAIMRQRDAGSASTVVRLPIMLGQDDHTGRLDFYRARIADGQGVLMVDGGENSAQVLWRDDAARALTALAGSNVAASRGIWEGLPDDGHRVSDFVSAVAQTMGRTVELVPAPANLVASRLNGYLDAEPLWRETPLKRTAANLFTQFGLNVASPAEWLRATPVGKLDLEPQQRQAEIALMRSLH